MPRSGSVVVGTDFSPSAGRAVERAARIARDRHATLHVVHVASRLPRALLRKLGGTGVAGDAQERIALARIVAQVRADGVVAKSHILGGAAASALRRKARELRAGLVVVGSSGSRVAHAVLGSTAERIVDLSGAPVLLVREARARDYRDVTVAADVDSDIRRAVDAATFVADGADQSIVHAYEGPFENKLRLQGAGPAALRTYRSHAREEARRALGVRLREAGLDERPLRMVHGNRRVVLAREAKRGTLMVLDRSESRARHMFLGSVTRWVIEHTETDVLLV